MKRTLFILFIFSFCSASSQSIKFQRAIGDSGWQANTRAWCTADGGYIIGGTTYLNYSTVGDFFLMKTDSIGNNLWMKTYGTTGHDGGTVWQTWDSCYLISGTIDKNNLFARILIKTDGNGDTLWVKRGIPSGPISSVIQSPQKGYYLMGINGYVCKTDTSGSVLWSKHYNTGLENGYATKDNGLILIGSTSRYASGGPSDQDLLLIKTDSSGTVQWTKVYGTTNGDEVGNDIYPTNDKGYICIGNTDGFGAGSNDVLVIKIDSIGNLQWTKTYGGAMFEQGIHILQIQGAPGYVGSVYTMGFEPPPYQQSIRTGFIKLDITGNLVFAKMYGAVQTNPINSPDYAFNIAQTNDGGFLLSGESHSFGSGLSDSWLIKTDANGVSGCNEITASLFVGTPNLIAGSGGYDSTIVVILTDTIIAVGTWNPKDSLLCPLPNNPGVNEFGLENFISLYPNPCSGIFAIKTEELEIKNVQVYNVLGARTAEVAGDRVPLRIDISAQPDGIYFVRVNTDRGIVSKKVVILR